MVFFAVVTTFGDEQTVEAAVLLRAFHRRALLQHGVVDSDLDGSEGLKSQFLQTFAQIAYVLGLIHLESGFALFTLQGEKFEGAVEVVSRRGRRASFLVLTELALKATQAMARVFVLRAVFDFAFHRKTFFLRNIEFVHANGTMAIFQVLQTVGNCPSHLHALVSFRVGVITRGAFFTLVLLKVKLAKLKALFDARGSI